MLPDQLFRPERYLAPRVAGYEYSEEEGQEGLILLAETQEGDGAYKPHNFKKTGGLLLGFLSLPLTGQYALFAKKHGMLRICPDNCRPYPHRPWANDLGCRPYRGRERASDWERVVDAFWAVMRITNKLQREELPTAEDWLPIVGDSQVGESSGVHKRNESKVPELLHESIDRDWAQLGETVSSWWLSSLPRPLLRYRPPTKIELDVCPTDLFGLLTWQLVSGVSRAKSFHVCAGCGKPFLPKRQPARGQRAWCGSSDCRRLQLRLAKQRQRHREKAKAGET